MDTAPVPRSKAGLGPPAAAGGPPCRRVLLSALLGAAFASTAHAQSAVLDEGPAVPSAAAAPAVDAVAHSTDVSDWGTHAAWPEPVPSDEDHRDPRPTLTVTEVTKRDEFEVTGLVLVDSPPTGPGDGPPEPSAKDTATVRFTAGAQETPTPGHEPDRASLMRRLAAILGADIDLAGHAVSHKDDAAPAAAAPQPPASAAQVLATLAEVLSDARRGSAHGTGIPLRELAPASPSAAKAERPQALQAPTPSAKVLDTLAQVLSGEPTRGSAPVSPPIDIAIEPATATPVDLEIEIGAPAPVDIDVDPIIVQPVDVELPLQAAFERDAAAPTAWPARPHPFGDGRLAVSDAGLDRARGGFTTPEGLRISFGIERAVYVNGSLVTTTSLNVSELGVMSAGGAPPSMPALGSIAVIQNGAGNTFVPGAVPAGTLGTVIQNSLDDQKIQSISVINASVNSLGMLRSMTMQSNLRNAIVDSLRR